jgi:hypothetical protein
LRGSGGEIPEYAHTSLKKGERERKSENDVGQNDKTREKEK